MSTNTKAKDAERAAAIDKGRAYMYACRVDCGPRDDTRAAAIAEGDGYWYARIIDQNSNTTKT